jgi:hypothetical protein
MQETYFLKKSLVAKYYGALQLVKFKSLRSDGIYQSHGLKND